LVLVAERRLLVVEEEGRLRLDSLGAQLLGEQLGVRPQRVGVPENPVPELVAAFGEEWRRFAAQRLLLTVTEPVMSTSSTAYGVCSSDSRRRPRRGSIQCIESQVSTSDRA
jgi:hypothetical protein